MQNFLASDVIFQSRFTPGLRGGADEQGLAAGRCRARASTSRTWTAPARTVVTGPARQRGGGSGEDAAPGLHGNGLGTVTLGGQTLTRGGLGQRASHRGPEFDVQVAN